MIVRTCSRRWAAGLGLAALFSCLAAEAGAPFAGTPSPGFYRIMLGDFEVTALFDGVLNLRVDELLTNTTPARVRALLARDSLTSPLETSVNAYLVNTGSKLVLVDTGAGDSLGPGLGKLQANLEASGYRPEQVDDVLLTHLHSDHSGGLVRNGARAFPNAKLHVDRLEADFWLTPVSSNDPSKQAHDVAIAMAEPYRAAGKLGTFSGDAEIVPGIRAAPAHGHTPGHSAYVVESGGHELVLWGDLMHVAAVQFPEPAVTISFDTDSNAARAQREAFFARAAKEGFLVGGAHISFPGLGHVRADGDGYVWVPVNYR